MESAVVGANDAPIKQPEMAFLVDFEADGNFTSLRKDDLETILHF